MLIFASKTKKEFIMDTMTIAFDDMNMVSVIRNLINSMNGVRIIPSETKAETKKHTVDTNNGKYKISPLIKAMETGFHLPDDISDNYKKEIGETRTKKYL